MNVEEQAERDGPAGVWDSRGQLIPASLLVLGGLGARSQFFLTPVFLEWRGPDLRPPLGISKGVRSSFC